MQLSDISRRRFLHTMAWAAGLCCLVVIIAAALGRAHLRIQAAVVDDPDLAVYLLKSDVRQSTLLRDKKTTRDYLVQTDNGPELITLSKNDGEKEWHITREEQLHETK